MTASDTAPPGAAGPATPTTVHLSGDIDLFTSAALRGQLLETLNTSTSLLVLDLSGVTFCDAGGLAVLIGIQRRARAQGITMMMVGPRPFLSRLLRMTGLGRSLRMVA
ncbi:STAS domain-containing protein [Nonomuraea gerenzanensis]|uniref:Anti-sigma factor antagonist n=1 Tax=Nonomuraea gerenzanensis TaxID=93944 RepID=A0A1M4EM73_9ACTN|nr:STAS domain-containing protein [Nonomuraea gerenzanensis]UBU11453.1 STAS domain-containing protein [Nonomuraea gerenzanensis]SBO99937.1 Anti-sigma F factor antagonist (spoIIAA-2); Anti-sigma B factor antagonist RsbV [Nonomuraea gerenzanensis]